MIPILKKKDCRDLQKAAVESKVSIKITPEEETMKLKIRCGSCRQKFKVEIEEPMIFNFDCPDCGAVHSFSAPNDVSQLNDEPLAPTAMVTPPFNYVLVDYENVQPKDMQMLDQKHFRLMVFLGAQQTKVSREIATMVDKMDERAEFVEVPASGPNALDFHIAFYLGELSRRKPGAYFHIISKDTGFDPLLAHLKERGIKASRKNTPPKPKPTAPARPQPQTKAQKDIVSRLQCVRAHFVRVNITRPTTLKKIANTLNSHLFKQELSTIEIDQVVQAMLEKKMIELVGEKKVKWLLPIDAEKKKAD